MHLCKKAILFAPLFYNALCGISYRLPNVTKIVAIGNYSVVCVVNRGNNHDIARDMTIEGSDQYRCIELFVELKYTTSKPKCYNIIALSNK